MRAFGRSRAWLWLLSDPVRLPDPAAAAARLPRGSVVVARGMAPGQLAALARLARARGLRLVVAADGRAALRHRAGLLVPDRHPTRGLLAFLRGRAARTRGVACGSAGAAPLPFSLTLRAVVVAGAAGQPVGAGADRAGLARPRAAVGDRLPHPAARWRVRRAPALLAVAAHGRAGLARARRLRADAVLLSPVFATASHPGAPALGPLRWAALAQRTGRPVVALGGLTPRNIGRLPRSTTGWAAIGWHAGPATTLSRQPCGDPATVSYGSRGGRM